ncbi:MAG: hypothetical protein V1837_06280 [Candidatus Woesearchaeota archaeon]
MTEKKPGTLLPMIIDYLRHAQYDISMDDGGGLLVMVRGAKNPNGGLDVLLERRGTNYTPREVTIYTPVGTFREERDLPKQT